MENISDSELAGRLLERCLTGKPWPREWLDRLAMGDASRALLGIVVEGLSDLFEPRLCVVYADLFSRAIARHIPELQSEHLFRRYQRIVKPRVLDRDPALVHSVFVLSRVTLGADVAVTSIVLDAAKRRFPDAVVYFVGPAKGWELFAGDGRLRHVPVSYGRGGTLGERLSAFPELRLALSQPESIVIDPDSRLTQLGLLPVCAEQDYYFFESRGYGGDSQDPLPVLTKRWLQATFGVEGAAYIRPLAEQFEAPDVTVSFGVGENQSKRVGGRFEEDLLRKLVQRGGRVLIDKGAGGEEAERVERAIAAAGGPVETWEGSFAGFASRIAASKLYVGYDSAGGHAAAACGVPMISVFRGEACERMFERWRPTGTGPIRVVRGDIGELSW